MLTLKTININLLLLFTILCLMVNQSVYSQFSVIDGVDVKINEDIISQERLNIIDTSISGTHSIIFTAATPQLLYASKTDVEVANLSILNTKLEINSPLTITGNLLVKASVLQLNQAIFLKGKLISDAYSKIEGLEKLNTQTEILPHQFPLTHHQNIKNVLFFTSTLEEKTQQNQLQNHTKTNQNYTEKLFTRMFTTVDDPPPKQLA